MAKTIYFISQSFTENTGSFSGFIEDFAKYVHNKGYKSVIMCGQLNKNQPLNESKEYVEIHRFPQKEIKFGIIFNSLPLASKIRKYFKKNPISKEDIIIANGETALAVLNKKYILRSPDQPAFTFLNNMKIADKEVSFKTRIARRIHFTIVYLVDYLITKKATGIIYSSMDNRREVIKYYPAKEIPFFIPNKCVKIKQSNKKNEKNIINILFIGKESEKIRKGIIYLERVLPEIFSKYSNVYLVHLGDKINWNIPEEFKERIISIGKVSWKEMLEYYNTCDLMVNCSLSEGIPSALLEAMAAGLPIVTSDINGVDEYITHLKEGYIYKKGDLNGLNEGIRYMLDHPKELDKMRILTKKKINSIDYEKFCNKLLSFVEEVNKNEKTNSINMLELNKEK